ncbi:MAG TPA: FimV/HubP family polar landmark protein, partial [Steroidobacteraceae bacterium]|nr:FimV/HubP family polar landmark protein [Steroidobacteraceae bacterium]
MTAKRSCRALALLLALPSAAFALGLGDVRLQSPLNAPLQAEIEVTDVAPDEVSTVQVRLAPREAFSQLGLDYPAFLTSVQLRLVQAGGHQLIKVKSTEAVTDPFITLLIQVSWSHGQLMREYTMLLDPPVYTPGQPAVASAPVSAPTTQADTRAGTIARAAEAPAAPAAPAVPAPATEAPATAATETAAPAPSATESAAPAASANPAPPPATAAAAEPGNTTHLVRKGETLSEIARGVSGASTTTGRTRSWMLAIYQANPRAFDQNMNVLRSGTVLRIPEASQADAIAPKDAAAEIRRQFSA